MELDFIPTLSLSHSAVLFILVEVVAARKKNVPTGLSCLKKHFCFLKGFVFLDLEAVERCRMGTLGGCEGCVYLQRRQVWTGQPGLPTQPSLGTFALLDDS